MEEVQAEVLGEALVDHGVANVNKLRARSLYCNGNSLGLMIYKQNTFNLEMED